MLPQGIMEEGKTEDIAEKMTVLSQIPDIHKNHAAGGR